MYAIEKNKINFLFLVTLHKVCPIAGAVWSLIGYYEAVILGLSIIYSLSQI